MKFGRFIKKTSLLLRPNNLFFLARYFRDTHPLMCKKLTSFVYIFFQQLSVFPNNSVNWHALSHEQYFLKRCFLNICHCTFRTCTHLFNNQVIYVHSSWDGSCLESPETNFASYTDINTPYVTTETFVVHVIKNRK